MNPGIIIVYAVLYFAIACITGVATEKRSAIWWPILLIKNIFRVLIWISKALVEAIKD